MAKVGEDLMITAADPRLMLSFSTLDSSFYILSVLIRNSPKHGGSSCLSGRCGSGTASAHATSDMRPTDMLEGICRHVAVADFGILG